MGLFKSLKKAVKDVGKFVKKNGPLIAAVGATVVSGGAAAPILAAAVSAGKKLLAKGGAVVSALDQQVAISLPGNEAPKQVQYKSALFSNPNTLARAPAAGDSGGGGIALAVGVGLAGIVLGKVFKIF